MNTDDDSGVYTTVAPHLLRYLNTQVTIHYHPGGAGMTDQGRITYIDNAWVELTKDNKDVLLIPTTAIRLIKAQEPARLFGDAAILLRAADAPPEEQRKQIGK
jgi:hypothetical protein